MQRSLLMRLLVVLNPSACDFRARARWPEMYRVLGRVAEVTLLETEPDEQRTLERVHEAVLKGPYDRVLAIGGDGTVHLVVNGIVSASLPELPELALIPFGTANNVAKSLRLPLKDREALARIAVGGRLEPLDVARIRLRSGKSHYERYWLNCVSIGMDADVVASRGRYRDLGGYLSYGAAIFERTLEQRSLDAHLSVDGKSVDARVFNLVVTNVPVYAGELWMPGAHGDGKLDVHLLDRVEYGSKMLSFALKKADVLKLGLSEMAESVTHNQRTLHGHSVKVRLAWPRHVQADGEALPPASEIDCDIVARLRVAAP
jgi:diacylglycerol kinase family enzyme